MEKFCRIHNLYTQNVNETTHLMMTGGKLKINPDMLIKFLGQYVKSIKNGETLSIVEKLGNNCTMRFFLDIDKMNIRKEFIDVFDSILPEVQYRIYSKETGLGTHVVFDKVVYKSDAICLAKSIAANLDSNLAKYIDCSVYSTGLRMIGSSKFTNNAYIDTCYMPIGNSKEDINIQMLKESIVRLKSLDNIETKIQTDKTNQECKIFEKISKHYANVKILGVRKYESCISIRVDSHYCQNVERNHKSNHIYFVLNNTRHIYQKCYNNSNEYSGRKICLCKDYKSKKIKLNKLTYDTFIETLTGLEKM